MGIAAERIQVLGALDTLIAPMGAVVDAYVGIADIGSLAELRPNADEVAESSVCRCRFLSITNRNATKRC